MMLRRLIILLLVVLSPQLEQPEQGKREEFLHAGLRRVAQTFHRERGV